MTGVIAATSQWHPNLPACLILAGLLLLLIADVLNHRYVKFKKHSEYVRRREAELDWQLKLNARRRRQSGTAKPFDWSKRGDAS